MKKYTNKLRQSLLPPGVHWVMVSSSMSLMCWLTAKQLVDLNLVDLQMLQHFGFPEAESRKEGKR